MVSEKEKSLSDSKLELSKELLDDIELSRLPEEKILLKACRLARLVGNGEVEKWLGWELHGYDQDGAASNYASWTGRLTNKEMSRGYWKPFASISSDVSVNELHLKQIDVPDISISTSSSNPHEVAGSWLNYNLDKIQKPTNDALSRMVTLSNEIKQYSDIKSKVISLVHMFVRNVCYELQFSALQSTMFEQQKAEIDLLLAKECGEVLKKVPSIYSRLAGNDSEAISQALNSCRRMITNFADAVYPPKDTDIEIDGEKYDIRVKKHLNRIVAFVREHCDSKSRRDRLKRAIHDIYDRLSTGSHNDVTGQEARYLFLNTYLLLGEIMSLKKLETRSSEETS